MRHLRFLHFARHRRDMLELAEQVRDVPLGGDVDLSSDVFMGHEFSAEILEAGPDATGRDPGHLTAEPVDGRETFPRPEKFATRL